MLVTVRNTKISLQYPLGLWPSSINRNWLKSRQKFSKTLLGTLLQQRGVRTRFMFPCSLSKVGWAGSFCGSEVRVVPCIQARGWLKCFAHPFVVLSAEGMRSTLLWLDPWQLWFLGLFAIFCPEFAQLCT